MTHRVKIYRSVGRCGSVISTELIDELDVREIPDDLQDFAEVSGGDFAAVENTSCEEEIAWQV